MPLSGPTPLPSADIPRRDRPLVVQSDGTVLLEVAAPQAGVARDALAAFAHLERSPEHVHTYRLTPLSLWNAASAGVELGWIEAVLTRLGRYPLPELVRSELREQVRRFGRARLLPHGRGLLELRVEEASLRLLFQRCETLQPYWAGETPEGLLVRAVDRGALKQALIKERYPVEDLCGYVQGQALPLRLAERDATGARLELRPYQLDAASAFHASGGPRGGAGVIVLPCGSGKTIVGIGVMQLLQTSTLILTTSTVAVRQWRAELLDKTDLVAEDIGEYTGQDKQIRPVTIATYQMLSWRRSADSAFTHLALLRRAEWGFVIYDEVHMLPAPVFRVTAEIQARRRLGLTATLVREDGREDDVFALIGPKRFELGWKVLEASGHIATATCTEVRLELPELLRMPYALAERRDRFRIAAENPDKLEVVAELLAANPDDQVLVIGQFLAQLDELAEGLDLPLITGKTPNSERQRLYEAFRSGQERVLVVSKVANFAIDLPDASLAIQVSGTYGSRQEEAQRLGRILRPKERPAQFITLVTRDTREQDFAAKRQLFLVEQGYRYTIVDLGEEGNTL